MPFCIYCQSYIKIYNIFGKNNDKGVDRKKLFNIMCDLAIISSQSIFHNRINCLVIQEIWSSCLSLVLYVTAADQTQNDHLMWYIIPDVTVNLYQLLNYMPIEL